MRFTPYPADTALRAILDPRRIVRWIYISRLSVASAIFLAAVFVWDRAQQSDTLVASLAFAAAMATTAASAMYSEIRRRPLGRTFLYLQNVFDLLLVTAAVHVTGGWESQFAALYILVIASAALLLPVRGVLLVAALGIAMYCADAIFTHDAAIDSGVLLQLAVFAVVALGSAAISAHLREAGVGSQRLAAELVKVRLQAADVLRNIRSGILTVDARGTLLFANPAASTLLDMNLDERLGAPVLDELRGIAPELVAALQETVHSGVRTSRAEGVVRLRTRRLAIGLNTTRMDAGPESPATATAIFQDISDQKRIETLRVRTERLEAVAELSASLAHEIKNPLASIRSAVEQLARMPASGEDERTLASLILRESDRLSRLLSEFLDFAGVRATRIDRVDLAAIVRGAVKLAGTHPDRRDGVELVCRGADVPVLIEGDEDLLHRAIFNLALNAVQATPPDGEVVVEITSASADQLPGADSALREDAVAVQVCDAGSGIAPEARDRLFTPFFTTKPGGSGLGLAVVHRAIEAHRGLVLVDSPGRGTRFTVLLPRAQSRNGGHS